jgi:K+-transporting ATPase A subunit
MTGQGLLQLALYVVVLVLLVKPLGAYMASRANARSCRRCLGLSSD